MSNLTHADTGTEMTKAEFEDAALHVIGTPTASGDVATKQYVDDHSGGGSSPWVKWTTLPTTGYSTDHLVVASATADMAGCPIKIVTDTPATFYGVIYAVSGTSVFYDGPAPTGTVTALYIGSRAMVTAQPITLFVGGDYGSATSSDLMAGITGAQPLFQNNSAGLSGAIARVTALHKTDAATSNPTVNVNGGAAVGGLTIVTAGPTTFADTHGDNALISAAHQMVAADTPIRISSDTAGTGTTPAQDLTVMITMVIL